MDIPFQGNGPDASVRVVGLVNLLAEMWDGREIIDEIAWTVMQVEQLSDDEVEKLLTRIA